MPWWSSSIGNWTNYMLHVSFARKDNSISHSGLKIFAFINHYRFTYLTHALGWCLLLPWGFNRCNRHPMRFIKGNKKTEGIQYFINLLFVFSAIKMTNDNWAMFSLAFRKEWWAALTVLKWCRKWFLWNPWNLTMCQLECIMSIAYIWGCLGLREHP